MVLAPQWGVTKKVRSPLSMPLCCELLCFGNDFGLLLTYVSFSYVFSEKHPGIEHILRIYEYIRERHHFNESTYVSPCLIFKARYLLLNSYLGFCIVFTSAFSIEDLSHLKPKYGLVPST
jgi:hypothetical protein